MRQSAAGGVSLSDDADVGAAGAVRNRDAIISVCPTAATEVGRHIKLRRVEPAYALYYGCAYLSE